MNIGMDKLVARLIEIEKDEIPDGCGLAMFTLYTDGTSCITVEDANEEEDYRIFHDLRDLDDFITTEKEE